MSILVATIQRNKNTLYVVIAAVIAAGTLLLAQPALAGFLGSSILTLLGWLIMPVVHFLGNVLLVLIEILIGVFKFTEFIDTPAVQLGWVVIRDLANMGIVIALIIIAFSTVFRVQKYAASQLLVRLIIAAFMVNFSLLIAGLLIDFGQVVMMTFVNEFSKLAAGNLTVGFGIEDMLKMSKTVVDNPAFDSGDFFVVLSAMLLAVVLLIVAIAVILVFIVVLLQRIIFLWILLIFAPVAWVAPLLPGGSSYSSQWWSNFSKQVFIGPTLAFGFWLSMSILAGLKNDQSLVQLAISNTAPGIVENNSSNIARFVTEVSTPQAIFDFMITVGLLLGTLWMAKQAGGMAGSFAGSMMSKLQQKGIQIAKSGAKTLGVAGAAVALGGGGVVAVGGTVLARGMLRRGLAGKGKLSGVLKGLNKIPGLKGTKFGQGAEKLGTGMRSIMSNIPLASGIAKDRQKAKDGRAVRRYQNFFEGMDLGEETGDWLAKHGQFNNIKEAGKRMSAASRNAKSYNAEVTGDDGAENIQSTRKSSLYTAGSGPSSMMKKFLGDFLEGNDKFLVNFKEAVLGRDEEHDASGKLVSPELDGMEEEMVEIWQKTVASAAKSHGWTSELGDMADILDKVGTRKKTREFEGEVASYSKTSIDKLDELKRHEAMKQRFEEFKMRPESKDLSDEELKQQFFQNEQAGQAYQAGNQAVRQFVEEAGGKGARPEDFAGIISTDHVTVNAQGQTVYQASEPPEASKMQADYEAMEAELEGIKPASEEGVTFGGFGRREGANTIAVGLDKVNEKMEEKGLGHITGLGDKDSEGVRVQNVDGVRQALVSIAEEQLSSLEQAQTGEAKVEALERLGIKASVEDENLDGKVDTAKGKAKAGLAKLNEKELVDQEGLILINKNRVPGSAREIIRHEQAHDQFANVDSDGNMREKLAAQASQDPTMMERIENHVKIRSDSAGMSSEKKVEEYAADHAAGRVQDDEFQVLLNESGLLKQTKAKPAQKIEVTASGEIRLKEESAEIRVKGLPIGKSSETDVGESGVQDLIDSVTPEIISKIDKHLKNRDNFETMSLADKVGLYASEVRASRVADREFEDMLLKGQESLSQQVDILSESKPQTKNKETTHKPAV